MARVQIIGTLAAVLFLAYSVESAAISKRSTCYRGMISRDETCSMTCNYGTGECEENMRATLCDCAGTKSESKGKSIFRDGKLSKQEGSKTTIGSCGHLYSRCTKCKKIPGGSGSSSSSASASKSEMCPKVGGGDDKKGAPKAGAHKGGAFKEWRDLDLFKFPKMPKFPEFPKIGIEEVDVDIFRIPFGEWFGFGKRKGNQKEKKPEESGAKKPAVKKPDENKTKKKNPEPVQKKPNAQVEKPKAKEAKPNTKHEQENAGKKKEGNADVKNQKAPETDAQQQNGKAVVKVPVKAAKKAAQKQDDGDVKVFMV